MGIDGLDRSWRLSAWGHRTTRAWNQYGVKDSAERLIKLASHGKHDILQSSLRLWPLFLPVCFDATPSLLSFSKKKCCCCVLWCVVVRCGALWCGAREQKKHTKIFKTKTHKPVLRQENFEKKKKNTGLKKFVCLAVWVGGWVVVCWCVCCVCGRRELVFFELACCPHSFCPFYS